MQLRTSTALTALVLATSPALADSFTDFESFTTNTSVNGQGGWSATSSWDEEVVDDGTGNLAWRVSNAVTGGSFGDMPLAPRPGGVVADPTIDAVNGLPNEFAGESSTGATHNQFIGSFRFRSATGTPQSGASVTVSADNGIGGRHGFIDIEDSSVATSGIDLITYDVNPDGSFSNAITIASALSYTEWHDFRLEIDFNDGASNDVARYYVNGSLVHTGTSWEDYYPNAQPGAHPDGVPVQTFIYRVSGGAVPTVLDGGFLIDDVDIQLGTVPEPGSLALLSLGGLAMLRRRRRNA